MSSITDDIKHELVLDGSPVTSATQEHDGHHIDKEQQPGGTDQLVNNTEAGQEEIQVDQKGQQDNVDDQAGQEDVVGNEHAFASAPSSMITTSPGSHKESVQQEQEYDQFALQQTAKTDACPDNGPEQTLPHDQAAVSDGGDVDGPHDQAPAHVPEAAVPTFGDEDGVQVQALIPKPAAVQASEVQDSGEPLQDQDQVSGSEPSGIQVTVGTSPIETDMQAIDIGTGNPAPADNSFPADQQDKADEGGREYGPSKRRYQDAKSIAERIEAIYGKKSA